MKRIAMIMDQIVQNIAAWDGESPWDPGAAWDLVDITNQSEVNIGWSFIDGLFQPPQ